MDIAEAKVDDKVDAINRYIDFMRDKNIRLKCKRLAQNTTALDFTALQEDEATMTAACQVISEAIMPDHHSTGFHCSARGWSSHDSSMSGN